jgi:hypothetical protein
MKERPFMQKKVVVVLNIGGVIETALEKQMPITMAGQEGNSADVLLEK